MDQNAKKRMSDSRGQQRGRRRDNGAMGKKGEHGATEQIVAIVFFRGPHLYTQGLSNSESFSPHYNPFFTRKSLLRRSVYRLLKLNKEVTVVQRRYLLQPIFRRESDFKMEFHPFRENHF